MTSDYLYIECPQCLEIVQVTLTLSIGEVVDGSLNVNVEPDLSDIWAHAWTHAEEADRG